MARSEEVVEVDLMGSNRSRCEMSDSSYGQYESSMKS